MALTAEQLFVLNHMNSKSRHVLLGNLLHRAPAIYKAKYDFSVHGGAVGSISLDDDVGDLSNPLGTVNASIPNKFVVYGGFIDIVTTLTSGGAATIAVGLNTTTDIKAATAVASWTAGIMAIVPVATAASAVKLTADREVVITVATAALTAGKFFVHLFGQLGD